MLFRDRSCRAWILDVYGRIHALQKQPEASQAKSGVQILRFNTGSRNLNTVCNKLRLTSQPQQHHADGGQDQHDLSRGEIAVIFGARMLPLEPLWFKTL